MLTEKTNLEVSKILTLSTAHLSRETRENMSRDTFNNEVEPTIYPKTLFGINYGWFVYFNNSDETRMHDLPDDLKAAIRFAGSIKNCDVICFDADAKPIKQLPTYPD